jgi:cell division protein FtsI (penicillin-binding protein 3)
MRWGRFRITDFRNYGPEMSVTDVIVKSSNIGTARMALMIGAERQQAFLRGSASSMPTPVELVEAPRPAASAQANWSEISTITISYGHGLSASPLHLAAAYATIAERRRRVTPTLLRRPTVACRAADRDPSAHRREHARRCCARR